MKENYDSKEKNTHEKERQHAVAEPQVSGTKVREILEESSTEQEVSSGADGVYTYRHCDTYEVANRLNAMLPAAHAAEQPKENWEPVRGQYVWVEGKLTENQPETFPKKLRVYVHGVGTGIAENVRPVTETEAEQPKLTWQQLRDVCESRETQDLLNASDEVYYSAILNALFIVPPPAVPPTPRFAQMIGGTWAGHNKGIHNENSFCRLAGCHSAAPPVAPGEQPRDPLDDNYQTWIAAQPPAQERASDEPLNELARELADVYWPNGTTEKQDALFDNQLAVVKTILRAALATAAKLAREAALTAVIEACDSEGYIHRSEIAGVKI